MDTDMPSSRRRAVILNMVIIGGLAVGMLTVLASYVPGSPTGTAGLQSTFLLVMALLSLAVVSIAPVRVRFRNPLLLAVAGFLAVACLSAFAGPVPISSIIGYAFEPGTVLWLASVALLALGASVFITGRQFAFSLAIVTVAVVVSLIHITDVVTGGTLGTYVAHASAGWVLSIGFVVATLVADIFWRHRRGRTVSLSAAGVVAGGLWLVGGSLAFATSAVVLVAIAAWRLFPKTASSPPVVSFSSAVLLVLFIFFPGSTYDARVVVEDTQQFTWQETQMLARNALTSGFPATFIGHGPNLAFETWTAVRPASHIHTDRWNAMPTETPAFLPGLAIQLGLAGLVLLALIVALGFRTILREALNLSPANRELMLAVVLVSFIAFLVDQPGSPTAFLGALAFGSMIAGSVIKHGNSATRKHVVAVIIVVCLAGVGGVAGGSDVRAGIWFDTLRFSPVGSEEADFDVAAFSGNDDFIRFASGRLQRIVSDALVSPATLDAGERAAVQSRMRDAIVLSIAATDVNPSNFANWMARGDAHRLSIRVLPDSSFSDADESYSIAATLNLHDPRPDLARAILYATGGGVTDATAFIRDAFAKKPDYREAIEFQRLLEEQ